MVMAVTEESDAGTVQERLAGHESDPEDNDYATPPEIWRPLARAVDGFDLDPASGAEPVAIADERYTRDDDGLRQPWHGWVWLNPPWSSSGDGSAKDEWLRKVRREVDRDAVDGVVVLLPAETSAHWFHSHVLAAEAVCLVGPGRIPFIGESRNPSFAMVLAAFGEVGGALLSALDELGAVFQSDQLVDEHPQVGLPEVSV